MDVTCHAENLPGLKKRLRLADIQARCVSAVSGSECYRQFQNMGFQYGRSFQTIERLWMGKREALGRIAIPAHLTADLAQYQVHPVLLDACFQMLLAISAMTVTEGREQMGLYLPVSVERIHVYGPPTAGMWCHAILLEQDAAFLKGSIVLCDDDENALIDIQDFRVQSLDNPASLISSTPRRLNDWLYDLQWQEHEPQESEPETLNEAGAWLILADDGGTGEKLARGLEELGQHSVLVFPGAEYSMQGERRYTIDPASPNDYRRLLSGLPDDLQVRCRGIVHLWSLNARSTEAINAVWLQAMQDLGTYSALYLIQALVESALFPRLWLVTQGAQAVEGENTLLALAQVPLWGFGRVAYEEYPVMRGALVDLDPAPASDHVALLLKEFQQADEEHQIAFRHDRRYVARLEHMHTADRRLAPSFRADASYLITGGFGALGHLVARWMIQRGARHLILVGRSQLPPRSAWQRIATDPPHARLIAQIRELEALGASIYPASVDVADEDALAAFLQEYQREGWPALRGVIHAAGIVQDQILWRMDKATFERVVRPKMLGGWALHSCLLHTPLDFFVLFSSVAALVVAPGQSNYAAANAFIDGLAHYRRAQGLPALSINWGPWSAGMITRLQLEDFYAQRGMECISPEMGMRILEHIFTCERNQVLVGSVNWPALFEVYPIVPCSIRHLGKQQDEDADVTTGSEPADIMSRLRLADESQRQELVEAHLAGIAARVLRIDPSRLDREQALNTLGLDSMIAIELKNRIELSLVVSLSVVDLLQGASVSQLATQVIQQLAASAAEQSQEETQQTAVEDLDQLSEQVDEALLEQLLQQIEQLPTDTMDGQLAADKVA